MSRNAVVKLGIRVLKGIYSKLPWRIKKIYRKFRRLYKSKRIHYAPGIDNYEEIQKEFSGRTLADLSSFRKKHRNLFQEDQEFFVIDSDNLEQVRSHFYGFSLQETGVYENANITEEALRTLDGRGAYVSVEADGKQIRIRQDFNGSYGLYYYHSDKYFAVSNSFQYLVEHLTSKQSLSLNKDFAAELLLQYLVVSTCSETAVNEICMLDRDLEITIDKKSGKLQMHKIDYKIDTFSLDTEEGLQVLDRWFHKWTALLQTIAGKTDYITVDLSGGFDSRLSFMLLLMSDIDLNRIRIRSVNDDLHTHGEDYRIASAIAEHFGFGLNHEPESEKVNYSLSDTVKIDYYTKLGIHKELYHKRFRYVSKHFTVTGAGGETKRKYWDKIPSDYIKGEMKRAARFSKSVGEPMAAAEQRMLKRTFLYVRKKYNILDRKTPDIPAFTYREGRCRNHFGKNVVADWFVNCCILSPLLDPDLGKLKLTTADCGDKNLLTAVIYERYCPDLLTFPFEGGREILPETILEARKINERFPYQGKTAQKKEDKDFTFLVDDENALAIRRENKNNLYTRDVKVEEFVEKVFLSEECREQFLKHFDKEIYYDAIRFAKEYKYHSLRYCVGILGLTAVLYNMENPESSALDKVISPLE